MPSNNSKYTPEIREQTAKYILENGKSARSVAEELGIDTNTICRWVREYRKKHNMPSYAEEKGIVQREPRTEGELMYRIKELERELKKKEKELKDEQEKVEILKNPCTSLCNHENEMRSDLCAQLRAFREEDAVPRDPLTESGIEEKTISDGAGAVHADRPGSFFSDGCQIQSQS